VRADHLDPARRRIDDGGLGRHYRSAFAECEPLAHQFLAYPAPAPERSRVPPVPLRALANGRV
jgi:hypothetical protein